MTNYLEDSEDVSDGQNSVDEGFHDVDLDISKLQKALDELKASRLLLSSTKRLQLYEEKLNVSSQKLNLLTKLSGSSTLRNQEENEKKPVVNVHHFYDDDESEYDNNSHKDNHFAMDDSDGDDDEREGFLCPFCYVNVEVHVLCSHLEDEHCFDLKNAVCPLCAANLGKDVIGHFIAQHAGSLKQRRKCQRSGLLAGTSAMLGKELSFFLGSSTNVKENTLESAPDPLISPFPGSVSISDPNGSQQDESSIRSASLTSHSKSCEISSLDGGSELGYEERRQRAAFVRQLIASTII